LNKTKKKEESVSNPNPPIKQQTKNEPNSQQDISSTFPSYNPFKNVETEESVSNPNPPIKQQTKKEQETGNSPLPQLDHVGIRISDVNNEPSQILSPIIGLLDKPLCSFDESIQFLKTKITGIEQFGFACSMFSNNIENDKKQNLSDDEIATINLYTMESNPRENSLYFVLNDALRNRDREVLKPFFPYLHLLLHSLCKLPKCHPGTVLWRGVQKNISMDYKKGKKVIWWGLSSCTKDMNALDTFLGKDGTERTLFSVQVNSAVDISNFSAYPSEQEILLFPCVTFEVQNVYSPSKGLWIVQLMEIFSPTKLINGFDSLGNYC